MQRLQFMITAAGIAMLPLASSWAASGSDVPPQTQSAAVPGASTDSGSATGVTTKPTNGTSGGGMSTASGQKAGGPAKENTVVTTGASQ